MFIEIVLLTVTEMFGHSAGPRTGVKLMHVHVRVVNYSYARYKSRILPVCNMVEMSVCVPGNREQRTVNHCHCPNTPYDTGY